jgi:glycosyltransferase involved in cell wall biosynthesis
MQVEAMLCGTPVVASNLPGVRQPVHRTGMGRIVPLRDARALAAAVLDVLRNPDGYLKSPEDVTRQFQMARILAEYEGVLRSTVRQVGGSAATEGAIGDREAVVAVEK